MVHKEFDKIIEVHKTFWWVQNGRCSNITYQIFLVWINVWIVYLLCTPYITHTLECIYFIKWSVVNKKQALLELKWNKRLLPIQKAIILIPAGRGSTGIKQSVFSNKPQTAPAVNHVASIIQGGSKVPLGGWVNS